MGSPLGWGCSQKSLATPEHDSWDGAPTSGEGYLPHRRTTPLRRKAAVRYFHAAPSLLNVKAADGMLRPALPPPGARDRTGLFLPWVSSWADPIRRQGERGNDPHQREEYP